MQNARLDEAQAGIKIARKNINNLRYADDTTLIAKSKKELNTFTLSFVTFSVLCALRNSVTFCGCLSRKESESEVAQSCPTLCDPMDSSLHQASPSMGFSRQEY